MRQQLVAEPDHEGPWVEPEQADREIDAHRQRPAHDCAEQCPAPLRRAPDPKTDDAEHAQGHTALGQHARQRDGQDRRIDARIDLEEQPNVDALHGSIYSIEILRSVFGLSDAWNAHDDAVHGAKAERKPRGLCSFVSRQTNGSYESTERIHKNTYDNVSRRHARASAGITMQEPRAAGSTGGSDCAGCGEASRLKRGRCSGSAFASASGLGPVSATGSEPAPRAPAPRAAGCQKNALPSSEPSSPSRACRWSL